MTTPKVERPSKPSCDRPSPRRLTPEEKRTTRRLLDALRGTVEAIDERFPRGS